MNDIGDKIYNLRKEKKVSQEELAKQLYVARQTVSKWETNTAQPSMENLAGMSKFFGVDIGYFFDLETNKETAVSAVVEMPTVVSEEVAEATVKEQPTESKFSTLKILLKVVAVVLLCFCVVACGIASYVTIAPDDRGTDDYVNVVNYVGIVFFVVGTVVAAILITLAVIFIKKRLKNKKTK